MSQRGVASRRAAEELIATGEVTVNGQVAGIVTFVDPDSDVVKVRGVRLPGEQQKAYYVMYKPRGFITGRADPQGRRSVLELASNLPVRVEPVGRLDYDTEGVLLLTNDGHLAHALTHPSREVPKRYIARVDGVPDGDTVRRIETGVELDDGTTAPAKIHVGDRHKGGAWVEVIVTEGRNRLVRRMMLAVGYPVIELRREGFAGITLRGLRPGEIRPLTDDEVQRLRDLAERPKRKRP